MKDYILSIVAAGMICAITNCLLSKESATGKIAKMLSGIFMCVTVLSPIANISFSHIGRYMDDLSFDASTYVDSGKADAETSISSIIKSRCEAYILDKAKSMGLDIAVEVELDDQNNSVPCGITIDGPVSPYIKEVISDYIESHLGIAKESQQWI